MKTTRKASTKEVIIIARIQFKHEDKVIYLVRASKPLKDGTYTLKAKGLVEVNGEKYQSVVRNGERYLVYQVLFVDGKLSGCTCPATTQCYHKKHLEVLEASRRSSSVAAPAQVEAVKVVESEAATVEAVEAEVSEEELEAILQEIEEARKQEEEARKAATATADISTRGTLNGGRAFSLMR